MEILKKLLEAGKITKEEHDEINAEVTSLTEQRDDARKESANRRVKLKEVEPLKKFVENLADKNGVVIDNGFDDLEKALSENKKDDGQLKALQDKYLDDKKSWEEKLNNSEADKVKIKKDFELRKELQKFNFHSYDAASKLIDEKTVFEDGVLKYNDSGVHIPLSEGLDKFAKENEWLINTQGKTGSGADGDGEGQKPKTLTEQHLAKQN